MKKQLLLICAGIAIHVAGLTQAINFTAVQATVDFSCTLQDWDGFGFNYVETAQTMDYTADPQEYGGFSLLDENEKQEIVNLVFGEDGLKVGLVKMFHDPWHQATPGGAFDHKKTTGNMRYFVREGLKKTRARGGDLQIITTLYGPPPWATKQKFLRGRDFDPEMKEALAAYMVDWVRFLREEEGFPVKYYSLHNEGEDWWRWPADGRDGNIGHGHDYNMYWPPELVVDFVKYVTDKMNAEGLGMWMCTMSGSCRCASRRIRTGNMGLIGVYMKRNQVPARMTWNRSPPASSRSSMERKDRSCRCTTAVHSTPLRTSATMASRM